MMLKLGHFFAACIGCTILSGAGQAAPVYTSIGFSGTANIQSNLIANGPSGSFTTSNAFATPFNVPTSGNNYAEVTSSTPLTLVVGVTGVTDVYTLINAYAPQTGVTVGTITFNFGNGLNESFDLIAGTNVRDYFRGSFANDLTSPDAVNAFTYTNANGGAGTGNSATGLVGTYVVDEQHFVLGPMAVGQTLSSVVLATTTGTGQNNGAGNGTPLLLGLTVEQSGGTAIPEPASLALLGMGVASIAAARRRRVA